MGSQTLRDQLVEKGFVSKERAHKLAREKQAKKREKRKREKLASVISKWRGWVVLSWANNNLPKDFRDFCSCCGKRLPEDKAKCSSLPETLKWALALRLGERDAAALRVCPFCADRRKDSSTKTRQGREEKP